MRIKAMCLAVMVVALAGCSKLNKENYDKLEMGMSQDAVEQILGSANSCDKSLGTMSCIWGTKDDKHIKVMFMSDKAVTFSYEKL